MTQASLVFRMKFCHVRLPIYKKSGVTRSPMQWYKLRLYEQRQKARPDPTLLSLFLRERLAKSSIGVRKTPFIRLVKQEQIHPMIHPKRALIRLRLKYINESLC